MAAMHFLFVLGLFVIDPIWYAVGLIGYVLYGGIGISLIYHRHFTHRCFSQFPTWLEHIGLFLGTLAGQGSCLEWALTHRQHHRAADGPADPHSPHHHNLFLYWTILKRKHDIPLMRVKDLLRKSLVTTYHRLYWIIHGSISIILFLISVELYMSVYAIPIVYGWIATGYGVAIASHKTGYRNYNTPDKSVNNRWVGLLVFGEGYQNNHHRFPKDPVLSKQPGEYDCLGRLAAKWFR